MHHHEEELEMLLSKFTARKLQQFYSAQHNLPDNVSPHHKNSLKRHSASNLFPQPPTLEKFLEIPCSVRKHKFFQNISVGDVVEGRVTDKWADDLFIRLDSVYYGPKRWIRDLKIKAECDLLEFKTHTGTRRLSDSISDFDIGDLVRGVVCNVNEKNWKIAVSFRRGLLPDELSHIELGAVEAQHDTWDSDNDASYLENLRSNPCFANPESINNLVSTLGIVSNKPSTFLEECLCDVNPDEYGEKLRDRQSTKWSMERVANGVKLFKERKHEEAMKCFDQALQMHSTNVEALVARGALKANQNLLKSAIEDFYKALEVHPSHRNGKKYLCETLITMAKQSEKDRLWKEASRRYKEVLQLDPDHAEAVDRFHQIQLILSQQVLAGKRTSLPIPNIVSKRVDLALSTEKSQSKSLKELLRDKIHKNSKKEKKSKSRSSKKKEKKKRKRKMKRSKSKDASSSGSNDTDPDATDSASEKPNSNSDDEWVEKVFEEKSRRDSSFKNKPSVSMRKSQNENLESLHDSTLKQNVDASRLVKSSSLEMLKIPGKSLQSNKEHTPCKIPKNEASASSSSTNSRRGSASDGRSFSASKYTDSNDSEERSGTHLVHCKHAGDSKIPADVKTFNESDQKLSENQRQEIQGLISYGRYGHTKDSYDKMKERDITTSIIPSEKIKNKRFSSDEIGFISQLLSKKHKD